MYSFNSRPASRLGAAFDSECHPHQTPKTAPAINKPKGLNIFASLSMEKSYDAWTTASTTARSAPEKRRSGRSGRRSEPFSTAGRSLGHTID
jgi:hypothetical protein